MHKVIPYSSRKLLLSPLFYKYFNFLVCCNISANKMLLCHFIDSDEISMK